MLSKKGIKYVEREWRSQIISGPKKHSSFNFYIDCHQPEMVSICEFYPFSLIRECTQILGEVTVFSRLDSNSGHLQMKIDERDCNKTSLHFH